VRCDEYVDDDPIVLAHGEALLTGDDDTALIQADLRRPDVILAHPKVVELIDFSRPVAVLFVSVLQFVPDDEQAAGVVRAFRERLCAGSQVVISTITGIGQDATKAKTITDAYQRSTAPAVLRTRPRIEALFDGLELTEPGLVPAPEWTAPGNRRAGPPGCSPASARAPEENAPRRTAAAVAPNHRRSTAKPSSRRAGRA